MSTGTTLYYPYIHPRRPDELKAALLYWDRIRRIVPDSVAHGKRVHGDDRDAEVLVDHELLISTNPAPYEPAAAERFFAHLEGKDDRFQIGFDTARDLARRNRGIHVEKLGSKILHQLHQRGLAQQFGNWVYMHDEVGAFYMHCLASEMATRMEAPLLTDSKEDAETGEAVLFQPQPGDGLTNSLVQLGINLPTPDELAHIPMVSIVAFAERRAAERQAFRLVSEALLESARSYQERDANALEDYLSSQQTQIREAVTNLRATLDELGVGAISGVAKLAVPSGVAAGLAALPLSPVAAAVLSVAGLAIAVVSCVAETRGKLRQARLSAPYHYLISMENEFGLVRPII